MRENRNFVVPVNILTSFAHAPFSWATQHTTMCLDMSKSPNEFSIETHKKTTPTKIIKILENVLAPLEEP